MDRNQLIAEVRKAIKDFPELNVLGDYNEEFSDSEIETALERSVNRINLVSPVSSWTLESLPQIFKEPLIYYTISILLQSRIREYSRNNIDYQSGGTGVTFNTIISEYAQAASIYEEKAELLTARVKIQMNLEGCFDTIESPHWYFGW